MNKSRLIIVFSILCVFFLIYIPSSLMAMYVTSVDLPNSINLKVLPKFNISFDTGDKYLEDMSSVENYVSIDNQTIKRVINNEVYGELPKYTFDHVKIRSWYDSDSYTNEILEDSIVNLTEDSVLYAKFSQDESSRNGVTVSSEWYGDREVIITINGTVNEQLYIRVADNDLLIGTSSAALFKSDYSVDPPFKTGDEVFVSYEPISGFANLKGSFTIKLRGASAACPALSTADLIEKHTKKNFNIDEPAYRTGILSEDAVDYISVFSDKGGSVFNNFRFKVSFGLVEDSN